MYSISNSAVSDDLEGFWKSFICCKHFKMQFLIRLWNSWQGFNWMRALHGAMAEFLIFRSHVLFVDFVCSVFVFLQVYVMKFFCCNIWDDVVNCCQLWSWFKDVVNYQASKWQWGILFWKNDLCTWHAINQHSQCTSTCSVHMDKMLYYIYAWIIFDYNMLYSYHSWRSCAAVC